MRLLFLTENHPPDRGGMAESCDRILRGLREAGAAVDVVHFDRRAVLPSFQPSGRGSRLRWPVAADLAHTINTLWNDLQRRTDLSATTHVVAFGGTAPLLAAPVFAAWIHRPLVTMLRGNELDLGLFDPRRRSILEDAVNRSAAICTLTSTHAEKIAALWGIESHVVPNGIDFQLWQVTEGDEERARHWRATNVPPSRRLIGLFGDLKAKKGVAFFVDALVRSGHADRFHLLFVGDLEPEMTASLNAIAGSPDGISFSHLPPTDRFELLPFYAACDLVALPSHYDGFPNVLIEAMALSRPLLASNTGGMADVLTDGETAFLFEPGDDAGCIEAVVRAARIADDALASMGLRCHETARSRCDAVIETQRYMEILHSLRSRTLTTVQTAGEK